MLHISLHNCPQKLRLSPMPFPHAPAALLLAGLAALCACALTPVAADVTVSTIEVTPGTPKAPKLATQGVTRVTDDQGVPLVFRRLSQSCGGGCSCSVGSCCGSGCSAACCVSGQQCCSAALGGGCCPSVGYVCCIDGCCPSNMVCCSSGGGCCNHPPPAPQPPQHPSIPSSNSKASQSQLLCVWRTHCDLLFLFCSWHFLQAREPMLVAASEQASSSPSSWQSITTAARASRKLKCTAPAFKTPSLGGRGG